MTTWLKGGIAAGIIAVALLLGLWLSPSPEPVDPAEPARLEPVFVGDAGASLGRAAPSVVPRQLPSPDPLSEALCLPDMAWVSGGYCVAGFEGPRGCRVPEARIGVCVDLFEYPNQLGVVPASMVTFGEAKEACAAEGKRLCRDSEWTLACRGTASLSGCCFGEGLPAPQRQRLWDPPQTARELSRVDGRRASGPSDCVSRYGVFDLPGNVEEWVQAEGAQGYDGALKGGHFNRGSIGCERSVQSRQLDARAVSTGFRCCRDPIVEPPSDSLRSQPRDAPPVP